MIFTIKNKIEAHSGMAGRLVIYLVIEEALQMEIKLYFNTTINYICNGAALKKVVVSKHKYKRLS